MALVDFLAYKMGCSYISDLRDVRARGQAYIHRLSRVITNIKAENHSLGEWNDMLEYLFSAPAESSVKDAKERALSLLADQAPEASQAASF